MKTRNIKVPFIHRIALGLLVAASVCITQTGCKKDILDEIPLAFMNPEATLTNKAGFESAVISLHSGARDLYFGQDGAKMWAMHIGTDVFTTGDHGLADFINYPTWLTPVQNSVNDIWDWAYLKMIPRANTIIEGAEKPGVTWASEAEKNAIVAEAKFFRAYAYNYLANLYGGVPIVDRVYTEDKRDFTRAKREEVYKFAQQDLEFAREWLPNAASLPGRIAKAAANHVLTEVNINLKDYDKAIEAATRVITGGRHSLMTSRFGNWLNQPGDAYSDLFRDRNQNLAANKETIWAVQMEFQTPGGIALANQGNTTLRAFGNRYWNLKDPDNKAGTVVADSLGRGVGWVRGTSYFLYSVWNDPNDIRNSRNNIRRDFYFNNPASAYFGKRVDPNNPKADTMYDHYPTLRKIEGEALMGASYGRTFKDWYMIRLAETYLLRAEAYIRKGDLQLAANDINVVRARSNAGAITSGMATVDFILDERARELYIEEPRRVTLARMGKLFERVKAYNPRSGASVQPTNELYPIPQKVIVANSGAAIPQNQGY
ncbi:MAG: RagB/SusD family protein [Segetibacter sp.]|nr:RagB/SusD family protein [Segetibacter sp.]